MKKLLSSCLTLILALSIPVFRGQKMTFAATISPNIVGPCSVHGTYEFESQGFVDVTDQNGNQIATMYGMYKCIYSGDLFIAEGRPNEGLAILHYFDVATFDVTGSYTNFWRAKLKPGYSVQYTTSATLPGYSFMSAP